MSDKELTDHFVGIIRLYVSSNSMEYDPCNPTSSHHLMWMIENMNGELKSAKFLGFIIGLMVANGIVDIENEQKYLAAFLRND